MFRSGQNRPSLVSSGCWVVFVSSAATNQSLSLVSKLVAFTPPAELDFIMDSLSAPLLLPPRSCPPLFSLLLFPSAFFWPLPFTFCLQLVSFITLHLAHVFLTFSPGVLPLPLFPHQQLNAALDDDKVNSLTAPSHTRLRAN